MARLRRLIEGQGMTFTQAGEAFGVSRSAIAGQVRKHGMISPNAQRNGVERALRYVSARKVRKPRLISVNVKVSKPLPVRQREPVEFKPRNISIDDLTTSTCRWPMWPTGDATGVYCGSGKEPDAPALIPYCATHCRMAYSRADRREPSNWRAA